MNSVLKPRYTIARESYSEGLAVELAPLLADHWQEIGLHQKERPLDVDWAVYRRNQELGKMIVWTARTDVLIGYSVFFLVRSPHYKSTLWAGNDVLYVAPAYRQSRVGLQLIDASERSVKEAGAKLISWHVKPFNADGSENPLFKILKKRRYEVGEFSMERLL